VVGQGSGEFNTPGPLAARRHSTGLQVDALRSKIMSARKLRGLQYIAAAAAWQSLPSCPLSPILASR
jgi:hypothetical protein